MKANEEPVVIEARQLSGSAADLMGVYQWIEANTAGSFEPLDVLEGRVPCPESGVSIDPSDGRLMIATPEGVVHVNPGDWIIRATHEPADQECSG